MSRLSLLALASLLSLPALTQAVIIYEPSPVPAPECPAAPRLDPYYQRQLQVLNYPTRTYAPSAAPSCIDRNTTVDMLDRPTPPEPLYYRKSTLTRDLIVRPTSLSNPPGSIIIIPKNLLNRPLNSFAPPKTA